VINVTGGYDKNPVCEECYKRDPDRSQVESGSRLLWLQGYDSDLWWAVDAQAEDMGADPPVGILQHISHLVQA
jgi:hypothetical protein